MSRLTACFSPWLQALWPACCAACGEVAPGPGLCVACAALTPPRSGPRCRQCDQPLPVEAPAHRCGRCLARPPAFERAWGVFDYAGPVGDGLRAGKYGRRPEIIAALADLVVAALPGELRADPPGAVVPVALHRRRVAQRRFDVPLVLGARIAKGLDVPLARWRLRRVRDTPEQAGLDEKARRRNLRGAFAVRGAPPLDVLLVDDVLTTGATAHSAADALRRAGAQRVRVLTAALVARGGAR